MQYVIVDTSSMLFGFDNKKDVFEAAGERFHGCGILISESIMTELRGLSRNKGRHGVAAKLALLSIRSKKIKVDYIKGPLASL